MDHAFESKPRVFVVDDEPEIAKLLVVMLQLNLMDAVPYFDSAEALAAAKETPPDYLISDIVMPQMSGIELALAFARDVPSCKVLLFSGQVDAAEQVQRANEGGHNFQLLQKPVHPKLLVEALVSL